MGSLLQLQDMIARRNWFILDTETTGLKTAEIVDIAIIDSDGSVLLNTLVKPSLSIPPAATQIHGITMDMVANAPTWQSVGTTVELLLDGRDVLVYNAKFDRHMCYSSDEHWDIERRPWREIGSWHCVMEAFAEFNGEINPRYGTYTWKSLGFAALRAGFLATQAHSALGDCMMTLHVVKFLHEMGTSL